MTTEQGPILVDGTWDLDNFIRDRYNAKVSPANIAKEIGRRRGYVVGRLDSLKKWGEVQHRPGGVWDYGCCSLPESERSCGVLRPSAVNPKCTKCGHRGEPYEGKTGAGL